MSSAEKLYLRIELPTLFKQHGLPEYSPRYLDKLSGLGEGPPIADVFAGRTRYAKEPALAWARARIARQNQAVLDRQELNRQFRQQKIQREIERLKQLAEQPAA